VIQLTKRDDSVYSGTDHPLRKRITSFLTQGLEKKTVNHLCCYNETNDNKSQVSMRPAYHSSKKVLVNDKLEAEVESNGIVLSIDCKDVGANKIESTLHDDLALKTWKYDLI
ncbi:hypothetical protein IGI04_029987, partial [Brassica rapa subsp. trilocularis]